MHLSVFLNHIQCAAEQSGITLSEALAAAVAAGIEAVECEPCDSLAEAEALRAELAGAGLRVSEVYAQLDLVHGVTDSKILTAIRQATALESPQLLVIPGYLDAGSDEAAALATVATGLARVCVLAREHGLAVLIEDFDHALSPCATQRQLTDLLETVPALSLAFDTGNFLFSGEEALTAFRALKSRIRHVHCKDRSFDPSRGGKPLLALDGRSLYPVWVGGGCIPMGELIAGLKEIGYAGYLSIEHFDSPDQAGDIRRSAEWLRREWNR